MSAVHIHNPSGRADMIKKIHVARRQLALEEESYRAILMRVTGKKSSAEMSIGQLDAVLNEFKRLGFHHHNGRAGQRRKATSAQASKLRALWLDLYHLGEIDNPSEQALTLFAKKMGGIDDLGWLTPDAANKIAKALRGWLVRIGYEHPTANDISHLEQVRKAAMVYSGDEDAIAAKLKLIVAQNKKLPPDLRLSNPAFMLMSGAELDERIEILGARVRA